MVEYNCPRCGHTTNKKSNIKDHIINRKKICKPVLSDLIPREHIDEILKGIRSVDKIARLEKEIEKLKNERKNDNKITTINNNDNRTTTTNIQNNNNITIVINPASDPQYDHLTDRDYEQCLRRMIMSVPNLIRKIHFDPKHPENHNIYIPNIQQKYAMSYSGKEWQLKNINDTIDNLLRNHEMILEEWVDCRDDEFPQAIKNFKTYLEKREENGVEDTIKEEIKLLLYNKRKMIKEKSKP